MMLAHVKNHISFPHFGIEAWVHACEYQVRRCFALLYDDVIK